ncbi:hypothetical protein J4212_00610 [Candidatus Woesearchaeota archaeon]|nr:hypothetical protein [Candidatus Woesearchaeota archaeon]
MVILFDQHNLPGNIFEVIFSTTQQVIVGRVLIDYMKKNGGSVSKSKLGQFATKLNEGKVITQIDEEPFRGKSIKLSYNKRQFYDRILTPLRAMGLIEYDLYNKTYKISEKFEKALVDISGMWKTEIVRKAVEVKFAD